MNKTFESVIADTVKEVIDNKFQELSEFFEQKMSFFENHALQLKTYSINEASKVTGINRRKITSAVAAGKIVSYRDGNIARIRHPDLVNYLGSLPKK